LRSCAQARAPRLLLLLLLLLLQKLPLLFPLVPDVHERSLAPNFIGQFFLLLSHASLLRIKG
jgi:hypothetical protein